MQENTNPQLFKDSKLNVCTTSSDLTLYVKNGFSQEASTLHRIQNLIKVSSSKRICINIAPQDYEIRSVLRDLKMQLIECPSTKAKLRSRSTRFFEQTICNTERHVITPYYYLDSTNDSLNISFKKLKQPLSSFCDETKEILAIIRQDTPKKIALTFFQRTPQEAKRIEKYMQDCMAFMKKVAAENECMSTIAIYKIFQGKRSLFAQTGKKNNGLMEDMNISAPKSPEVKDKHRGTPHGMSKYQLKLQRKQEEMQLGY